jgi:glycosyltransferase involved in cell wall biosynthesis
MPATAERSVVNEVLCFSHLRWNFVFQRPQHLLTRCATDRRVLYVEEPEFVAAATPHLKIVAQPPLKIVVPQLPLGMEPKAITTSLRSLIDELVQTERLRRPLLWYYTPMALEFTDHVDSAAILYDCMDELSAFQGAPKRLQDWEARLVERAALMLTGGRSLYEAKRVQYRHPNLHLFPSSVDTAHFGLARESLPAPSDQAHLTRPRLGFFGVIDERLDIALLDAVAAAQPEWQFVMVGPVVKIDSDSLPQRPNIHYLGKKGYGELPAYLAGWDVALLPFARNESTRFISPTKTPEYLAAGKPVVSTSIRDVVTPYGDEGLVRIADDPKAFAHACAAAMAQDRATHLAAADAFLRTTSWEATWKSIDELIGNTLQRRTEAGEQSPSAVTV